MSTQSYYKDRLGFDPREALYDSVPVKPIRGRSVETNNISYDSADGSPSKKQKQNGESGYEDALTQFKGTMSVWNYFVENCDIIGMSKAIRIADWRSFSMFVYFPVNINNIEFGLRAADINSLYIVRKRQ